MFRSLIWFLRNEARDWVAAFILVAGVIAIIRLADGRWVVAAPLLLLFVGVVIWLFFLTAPTASARDEEHDETS